MVIPLFKVEGKKLRTGNYGTEGTCAKGHTVFKKDGDTSSQYKCPYDKCGHDVP